MVQSHRPTLPILIYASLYIRMHVLWIITCALSRVSVLAYSSLHCGLIRSGNETTIWDVATSGAKDTPQPFRGYYKLPGDTRQLEPAAPEDAHP